MILNNLIQLFFLTLLLSCSNSNDKSKLSTNDRLNQRKHHFDEGLKEINLSEKESRKIRSDSGIKLQNKLMYDATSNLDSLASNYFNFINEGRLSFTIIDDVKFDSLSNIFFRPPNEQRGLILRDSLSKIDSLTIRVEQLEAAINTHDSTDWWMNYDYYGFCTNGNYDWLRESADKTTHRILLKNGNQIDYPIIYSKNKEHYLYIESYETASTYETVIIIDKYFQTNLNNLIISKSFWISDSTLAFDLSQKIDFQKLDDDQSNILRTSYFLIKVNK